MINGTERDGQETPDNAPRDDLEVELKILNIGSLENFIQRILAAGGTRITERTLVRTEYFEQRPERTSNPVHVSIEINLGNEQSMLTWSTRSLHLSIPVPESPEKIAACLALFGIRGDNEIAVEQLPERMVRVRTIGNHLTLTVKTIRQPHATIDQRHEQEIQLGSLEDIRLFLKTIGYTPKSFLEKYRTNYTLGDTLISIDELPRVPPFAEIEGKDPSAVFAIIEKLGFQKTHTATISQIEYLRRCGVSEEQLSSVRF